MYRVGPSNSIPFVSLFTGAGGFDLGLEAAGFSCVLAVESDKDARHTIAANWPSVTLFDDVRALTPDTIRMQSGMHNLPLIVGGPPCQAFSTAGKRRGTNDDRGRLIFEFLRLVAEVKPMVFIMENVRGLLSIDKGTLFESFSTAATEIGFKIDTFVVNAVNYGAPQNRERIIILGNRYGLTATFPKPTHSNRPQDGLPPFHTVGDAIGGAFIDSYPEVMDFSQRKLEFLKYVPPGGNWRHMPTDIQKQAMGTAYSLSGGRSGHWRRLSYFFPSPTIVTMPNHASTSLCHPTELRAISVGEAAALQGFPANWRFCGSTTSKMRQIGNAVPVALGTIAGQEARSLLERINCGEHGEAGNTVTHIRPHVRTRSFWKDGEVSTPGCDYYTS